MHTFNFGVLLHADIVCRTSNARRLPSSEPSGKDEGKRLRSARKRRIPSRSCRREAFEWVLLVFDAVDAIGKSRGEEVEEELDQWAEEMGESQAKAMKLNLHPLLEQVSGAMATSQDLPFRPSTSVIAKPGGRSKH
ncbi:hypothetical protein C1H46_038548 [Malus baccata]|uniref:Uncharacterized protein n=1 Tax=Malus baccata TaxID=106549 RepID=A0A540KP10_MALBA|nr:hypothetical protein C1H46_038548 [Malus baccata]